MLYGTRECTHTSSAAATACPTCTRPPTYSYGTRQCAHTSAAAAAACHTCSAWREASARGELPPPRNPLQLVGDTERAHTARVLDLAFRNGYLDVDGHMDRAAKAHTAVCPSDLDALTTDIPHRVRRQAQVPPPPPPGNDADVIFGLLLVILVIIGLIVLVGFAVSVGADFLLLLPVAVLAFALLKRLR